MATQKPYTVYYAGLQCSLHLSIILGVLLRSLASRASVVLANYRSTVTMTESPQILYEDSKKILTWNAPSIEFNPWSRFGSRKNDGTRHTYHSGE